MVDWSVNHTGGVTRGPERAALRVHGARFDAWVVCEE